MNFIFEWQNNIVYRVMFFLLYRQKDMEKIIDFYSPKSNCDGSDLQYSLRSMALLSGALHQNARESASERVAKPLEK